MQKSYALGSVDVNSKVCVPLMHPEFLNNLTPADVYYARGQELLDQRTAIKLNTLAMRRKMHYDNRNNLNLMG
jgi:hypothetical protein